MRNNCINKPYNKTAKPYEICIQKYLFADRKLFWTDFEHIRFYSNLNSVKDALRDLIPISYGNRSLVHPRNGKIITFRYKYVVCTRDENNMYKNISNQI